ncbi:bi-domain-containing oxidoreductase [bacterium]|nr:MAG: bi-domain-containing oxidoreductase [bacterium]
MRQVFLQKGRACVHNVDHPHIGDQELLVQVHHSFISSGTEGATLNASGLSLLQKFNSNVKENTNKVLGAVQENGISGTFALIKSKRNQILPVGYSCSGEVLQVGNKVTGFAVGDFVACAGAGIANHADFIAVPSPLAVKLRDKKNLKMASITTIGAIALQGIRRAQLQVGERVCVIGLGLIGQITAQLAKISGAHVFGVDINERQIRLAKKLGADICLNATECNVVEEINYTTHHFGVDTTIITASASSGEILEQAMKITRRKGRVVLVGDVKIDFDREEFYRKEIDLLISCSYGPGRYDPSYEKDGNDYPYAYVRWTENRNMELFLELIEKEKICIEKLISHEFNIEQAEEAFQYLQQKNSFGLMLNYEASTTKPLSYLVNQQEYEPKSYQYTPPKDTLNVGIIGAGGFCKIKLLPIISKVPKTTIHSIIDTDQANALNTARQYSSSIIGNDHRKLLMNENVHAAIIATPHHLHAEQAIDCLKNNKAVFVEKPAAVNFEQFYEIKNFMQANPQALYCVDFNRSFSPFIKDIYEVVSKRTNPLVIHYRLNAGFLPREHWIQSDVNRGRIIGEACHIFELLCFLTNARPRVVSVYAMNALGPDIPTTDNFVASISMTDGSFCSFVYTSLGSGTAGKEYMEIFFDGKTIIMNDFIELKGYGLPLAFNKKVRTADKGHAALIEEFCYAAQTRNAPSPTPFERIADATELSLVIDLLARSGGGCRKLPYTGEQPRNS